MTRRRFLIRAARWVGVVGVLLTAAYLFLVPWLVRREIVSTLHSLGLTDVDLKVRRVSPWNLDVVDFKVGGKTADRVGHVGVKYSPSTLWNGRIDEARLTGAEVVLLVADGRLSLGTLSRLKSRDTAAGPALLDYPFKRIDLESCTLTLRLPARTLQFPAAGSFARAANGQFKITLTLMVGATPLHLDGAIGPAPNEVRLTATGQQIDAALVCEIVSAFSPGTRVSADGTLNARATTHWSAGEGDIAVRLEPVGLTVAISTPGRSQKVTNFSGIGGVYEGEASFATGTPARGRLTIRDAGFSSESWGCSAQGVSGSMSLDDLEKLHTEPAQRIDVGKLDVGKLQFANGSLLFGLDGPRSINIRKTQWAWLGGSVWADDFRLDPGRLKLNVTMQLADVDLRQLLDFFAPDRASGEGRLSGRVPLVVDWPSVEFGSGEVHAAAGGTVRVKDLQAMAAALDQTGQANTADLKRKVFEALGDFAYDVLRADLRNEPNGLMAEIQLAGRGRSGDKTPLDTRLRVHGLDDLLKLYLGYQNRGSTTRVTN